MRVGAPFRFDRHELSGALGDLGTLLPLMLGCIAVAGLAPLPVLLGFAAFYVGTALWYRLPIPVQPMKAVAAVLLTTGAAPETLMASGAMIGLVLLLLGVTGLADRLGRLVPQSVLVGLQLGLGLGLALAALELMRAAPVFAAAFTILLVGLILVPRLPATLVALVAAIAAGLVLGLPGIPLGAGGSSGAPGWPSAAQLMTAVTTIALPQLSLTLTNAILLTALVAQDYFGAEASHVTPRRLSISTGLANLVLAPFGVLPMCHGAGGLAAHHRFGARSGGAPLMLGAGLLVLALLPGGLGLALLASIPAAALGGLLLLAAFELGFSRRLIDSRLSCRPVIAVAAGVTLFIDPFWGLVAGLLAEMARAAVVRARAARGA